jgi:hypothetical protein
VGVALSQLSIRRREGWRTTLVGAVLVYVGMRLVSAVVILLAQHHQPAYPGLSSTPYLGMIMHWDALWYRTIAMTGYPQQLPHHLDGAIAQNQWAFFPAFPFVTRAVMQLTDTDFAVAASMVDLVAGVVAACAIARLLETRIPRAATLAVVGVWAALPMAVTLQLPYSEALALALLTLALLWLVREQWGRAAVAALLLGLTRPILPPLVVVYGVAVWRRWRRRASDPVAPAEWWRMSTGLGLTVAGAAVWPVIAWWVTGVPDAYARTEAAWHHGSVAPFSGIGALYRVTAHGHLLWSHLAIVAAVGLVVVLTILAARSPRLDPTLVTWCWAYLVFDLAVAKMHGDELRMLLPLFPLVAVACGVASSTLATRWRQRAWLGASLGIVGQYAWVMLFVRYLPGVAHAP